MKTILAIWMLALIQTGYSDEFDDVVNTAIDSCVTKLGYNKDIALERLEQEEIPEDDEKAIQFFDCFSLANGVRNSNGEVNPEKLLAVAKYNLKVRHPGLDDAELQRIASNAIAQCKDTPKAESPGVTAIRGRNCVRKLNV